MLANAEGLLGVWFETYTTLAKDLGEFSAKHSVLQLTMTQLTEYFSGRRKDFDLPLAASGTAFQQSVWQALREIPFGQTASYLDLAQSIKNPKAVRAVGSANGKNPISIVVPCHRVIGTNGKLTGYAGGLDRKLWLLEHEGCKTLI